MKLSPISPQQVVELHVADLKRSYHIVGYIDTWFFDFSSIRDDAADMGGDAYFLQNQYPEGCRYAVIKFTNSRPPQPTP